VPKINGPEVSKGFWITLGVMLALLLMSVGTMALQRARSGRA
jgi:hypothetical protein